MTLNPVVAFLKTHALLLAGRSFAMRFMARRCVPGSVSYEIQQAGDAEHRRWTPP